MMLPNSNLLGAFTLMDVANIFLCLPFHKILIPIFIGDAEL